METLIHQRFLDAFTLYTHEEEKMPQEAKLFE
jgi:hypothetical protein